MENLYNLNLSGNIVETKEICLNKNIYEILSGKSKIYKIIYALN